jgi:hypothetical protein
MSDKKFSIEAVFKAIDNFTRPMKSMTDAAGRMAKQMTKGLSQVNTLNDKVLGGVQKLVAATTVAAGLTAVGVAGIIATGKEFDKTLVAAPLALKSFVLRPSASARQQSSTLSKVPRRSRT